MRGAFGSAALLAPMLLAMFHADLAGASEHGRLADPTAAGALRPSTAWFDDVAPPGADIALPRSIEPWSPAPWERDGRSRAAFGARSPLDPVIALPELPFAPALRYRGPHGWLGGTPLLSQDTDYLGLARTWLPTLLVTGTWIALKELVDDPKHARFAGRNAFDSGLADAFEGGSSKTRKQAALASDWLLMSLEGMLAADWLLLRHDYPILDSARIDGGWFLANRVVKRVVKVSVARERPFVKECEADPDFVSYCGDTASPSFYSAHTSDAATIAGLICARHLNRPERGLWDVGTCAGAVATSVATGVMRVTAAKHYSTDVIAAWLAGAVFGYVLPSRFNYAAEIDEAGSWGWVEPFVSFDSVGLRYELRF